MSINKDKFPDYLLIKDLPGYKKGCIFTMDNTYIYYISYEPDKEDWAKIDNMEPGIPLLRFNIYQMENNKEWFLKIDKGVERDLKLNKILQGESDL